jgi:hypothetical protein
VSIQETLADRGKRYGSYSIHASVTQAIKGIIYQYGKDKYTPAQREALDMIAHKIGRIVAGDPNYDDSWVDIAGYAQLVVDDLRGIKREGEYKNALGQGVGTVDVRAVVDGLTSYGTITKYAG